MVVSKVCRTCQETKPINSFYTYTKPDCRACSRVQGSKYREDKKIRDREEMLAEEKVIARLDKAKEYFSRNKEVKSKVDTDDDDSSPDSFIEDGKHLVRAMSVKEHDKKVVPKRLDDSSTDSSSESSESSESSGSDAVPEGSKDTSDTKITYVTGEDLEWLVTMILKQRELIRRLEKRVKRLEDERLERSVSTLAIK